jgi:cyclopropane-fatty-acyl-phospholipid synthase
MAYSSAYFTRQGQSLHDAQTAKLDMICRKLDLKRGMRLLDVGCHRYHAVCPAARLHRRARQTVAWPTASR